MIPGLKHSQSIYNNILKNYVKHDIYWLDLGCGHRILPFWLYEEEKNLVNISQLVVGIDYNLSSLKNHKSIYIKIRGDITKLPFKKKYFDLVTANMVVEHLNEPDIQFKEISRILKPKGIFILHTPNIFNLWIIIARLVPDKIKLVFIKLLEGREEKDIFDVHYKVNSRKKILNVASKSGFQVLKLKMIVSTPVLSIIPPLVIFELIWIRILMMTPFKLFRSNIIAILINNDSF